MYIQILFHNIWGMFILNVQIDLKEKEEEEEDEGEQEEDEEYHDEEQQDDIQQEVQVILKPLSTLLVERVKAVIV